MADITSIFGGEYFAPEPPKNLGTPEEQLANALREAGIEPPDKIIMDGVIHRFRSGTVGKNHYASDKPGWYVAFNDNIPAGAFGCFRLGVVQNWHANIGRNLTSEEKMAMRRRMEQAKLLRDSELKKLHESVSHVVEKIWEAASPANEDHPYLKKKGIGTHGARVIGDGRLAIPLFNKAGELRSLQYISADSGKLYHSGGEVRGNFWVVGNLDTSGPIYLAEGFATAATIHETTNRPCVIAYSASNLPPVTQSVKDLYPEAELVIVADNDARGVGQNYADQASAKTGARVITIPIEGMDANDYVQEGHDLLMLLVSQSGSQIVEKLKMVFGNELSADYDPPDELIEGLLTLKATTVLYGDSNSGKTFWALSLATAVATGSAFYGRQVDSGLVIYLASEAPASIRSRVQAIKKFYNCDLENLAIVPVPLNFYQGNQDAQDVIEAVRAIESMKGKPVRLIIGDTLARMSAGANENSGEDMGPVMARFESIAVKTNAAMLIIHHNGKDAAKGARGWSGIRAHIDTEIEVTENEGIRCASVTKQRELPSKGDSIYFKLEVVEMGLTKFGKPATTCVAVPAPENMATVQPKKPSKHAENVRTLERAWWFSGSEIKQASPYISRSALLDMLMKDGLSQSAAEKRLNPSNGAGIILPAMNANILEPFEHGWIFVDDTMVSAMLMSKKAVTTS